jgi:hypothetical protein
MITENVYQLQLNERRMWLREQFVVNSFRYNIFNAYKIELE